MGSRIIKKRLSINNKYNIKTRYVVDGIYIFPTKAKAEVFVKKYPKR